MDCLGPTWHSLYTRQDSTIFQSFAWNRLAARAFVERERPYCVMVSTDSGAAIIPAAIGDHGRRIVLLGDALFDYRDVLAGGDEDALRRAWGELARLKLPMAVTAVRESALSHWQDMDVRTFTAAPRVLRSEMGVEQFEAEHRKLGRCMRILERKGVKIAIRDGRESKCLRWIYHQKALQFARKRDNLFTDDRRIEFMVNAAALNPARCTIFSMESGSKVVAALITFRDRKVRRFYTIYFDPAWARYSPGQVLVYEATRRTLAAGMDCDYMTGEQPHKTRLATSSARLYRIEADAERLRLAASEPAVQRAA